MGAIERAAGAVLVFAAAIAAPCLAAPDAGLFLIALNRDAAEPAVETLIRFKACTNEDIVLDRAARDNSDPDHKVADEDLLGVLLAKVLFVQRIESAHGCWLGGRTDERTQAVRGKLDRAFPLTGAACTAEAGEGVYLTRACMIEQVNRLILRSTKVGEVGSAGLPCFPPTNIPLAAGGRFETWGEWDVSLRELTRLLYLDRARPVLSPAARAHLSWNLLTSSGGPAPESYDPLDCGNREAVTGSPRERAEEYDFMSNLFPDLGDLLDWLRRIITNPLSIPRELGSTLLGPLWQEIQAVVPGLSAFSFAAIPESENHLLQINSSKFLKNQADLESLSPTYPGVSLWRYRQAQTREWLLARLQQIAREDFREYNARPYTRYSISAIRNLHDFSSDSELRKAAHSILDLTFAKAALGSSDNRRFVPFRRRMEAIGKVLEPDRAGNGLFDMKELGDHVIGSMLVYTGNWSQAPKPGFASVTAASDMIFAAASDYRPPASVTDLARVPARRAALQTIRHAGVEIYYRTPAFLLTAGGIRTGPADSLLILGTPTGGGGIGPIATAPGEGYGAALPTTLMFHATNVPRSSLEEFLRIEGPYGPAGDENRTYDHNLCVRDGFACGDAVRIPTAIAEKCIAPPTADGWRFLDSGCVGNSSGHRAFVAIYVEECGPGCNIGFFEAVDAEPPFDFAAFQTRVISANAQRRPQWRQTLGGLPALQGDYVSARPGQPVIRFSTIGHRRDSQATGIAMYGAVTVPPLDAWRRAQGPLSGDAGSMRFSFRHPDPPARGFDLDLSDHRNPIRTELP